MKLHILTIIVALAITYALIFFKPQVLMDSFTAWTLTILVSLVIINALRNLDILSDEKPVQ